MFKLINVTRNQDWGNYETRKEVDKVVRDYLLHHMYGKERFEIYDGSKLVSRVQIKHW